MIKHYELLRSHFVAPADHDEPCLPRTLTLLMDKGLAVWIKALCCQASFECPKQSHPVDLSERVQVVQGLSGLQAEVVHLLSTMIENQINCDTKG